MVGGFYAPLPTLKILLWSLDCPGTHHPFPNFLSTKVIGVHHHAPLKFTFKCGILFVTLPADAFIGFVSKGLDSACQCSLKKWKLKTATFIDCVNSLLSARHFRRVWEVPPLCCHRDLLDLYSLAIPELKAASQRTASWGSWSGRLVSPALGRMCVLLLELILKHIYNDSA